MEQLTRDRIHDLLDDVMDADNENFHRFSLWRTSDGKCTLTVKLGDVTYEEVRLWNDVAGAVLRATEATDAGLPVPEDNDE